ncbi:hypothetical protein QYF61_027727 [Mycteria americana]|uniref:Uncharacterized protein n=1 Tax=Mycteria americana TaxID=33587 RepID=A0AAN7PN34_MYCAM|nr:hypothetical protein QYF61_027727 [Mycteria americana]
MIKGLENLPYEKQLKCLKGSYKEDGGSLFTRSHMEKIRVNRYKSQQERFHLDTRKFFQSESNHSLEQPPQGHSKVPIAGGFQDAVGQGARYSHLGSLSHERFSFTHDSSISFHPKQYRAWVPSHEIWPFINFSNIGPSHEQQLFKNYSSMGPPQAAVPAGNLLQRGHSMGCSFLQGISISCAKTTRQKPMRNRSKPKSINTPITFNT